MVEGVDLKCVDSSLIVEDWVGGGMFSHRSGKWWKVEVTGTHTDGEGFEGEIHQLLIVNNEFMKYGGFNFLKTDVKEEIDPDEVDLTDCRTCMFEGVMVRLGATQNKLELGWHRVYGDACPPRFLVNPFKMECMERIVEETEETYWLDHCCGCLGCKDPGFRNKFSANNIVVKCYFNGCPLIFHLSCYENDILNAFKWWGDGMPVHMPLCRYCLPFYRSRGQSGNGCSYPECIVENAGLSDCSVDGCTLKMHAQCQEYMEKNLMQVKGFGKPLCYFHMCSGFVYPSVDDARDVQVSEVIGRDAYMSARRIFDRKKSLSSSMKKHGNDKELSTKRNESSVNGNSLLTDLNAPYGKLMSVPERKEWLKVNKTKIKDCVYAATNHAKFQTLALSAKQVLASCRDDQVVDSDGCFWDSGGKELVLKEALSKPGVDQMWKMQAMQVLKHLHFSVPGGKVRKRSAPKDPAPGQVSVLCPAPGCKWK